MGIIKISLVSLGQTGAGPVYSLEMAKALFNNTNCLLQVIISSDVTNINSWDAAFKSSRVDYHVINSYKRTKCSVLKNNFNYIKQERLVTLVKKFGADVLYIPFGLMWARYVYMRLHKSMHIISTLHDVEFHDSWRNLSIAELGGYLLNYGSDKYISGHVVLNNKDRNIVADKTGKPVCVIPHASFSYYFKKSKTKYYINKCIGFFGRIEAYKGLDVLIDAFESCKTDGLQLLIAGNGGIDEPLLTRIKINPKIELINRYIKDEEFEELMDRVDIVVLPYRRASQSGVIPMCFAAGKTVIATNVGALSEQVPENTGVLTNVDAVEIARSIDELYVDPDRIILYGKNAKHYADTELTWSRSAELLLDFCYKLCQE